MAKRIFSPRERPLAQSLARLILENPFEDDRHRLEREILGISGRDHSDRSELASILALLEDLLRSCRAQLQESPVQAGSADATLYQELVLLHLFYQHGRDFDRLIEVSHGRGSADQRIPFYERFIRELGYWLPGGLSGECAAIGEARIFALFFQVRRAFQHLFQDIVGTSPAAQRLRARLWQSLFTVRMDRYRRSLVGRMADVVTTLTGPGGVGKGRVAHALALSRYIPFNPQRSEFEHDFLRGFVPIQVDAHQNGVLERHLLRNALPATATARNTATAASSESANDAALSDALEQVTAYGTLFFDEITRIEPALQGIILALLHLRGRPPAGQSTSQFYQGYLVFASKVDLAAAVERGQLSEELYFRIGADRIQLESLASTLAEYPSELDKLVLNCARKLAGADEAPALTDEVLQAIKRDLPPNYEWPGNYRELEQCVRSVLMHGNYTPVPLSTQSSPSALLAGEFERGSLSVDALLSRYITHLFAHTPNYEELGRKLGIDRRTVKKYVRPLQAGG